MKLFQKLYTTIFAAGKIQPKEINENDALLLKQSNPTYLFSSSSAFAQKRTLSLLILFIGYVLSLFDRHPEENNHFFSQKTLAHFLWVSGVSLLIDSLFEFSNKKVVEYIYDRQFKKAQQNRKVKQKIRKGHARAEMKPIEPHLQFSKEYYGFIRKQQLVKKSFDLLMAIGSLGLNLQNIQISVEKGISPFALSYFEEIGDAGPILNLVNIPLTATFFLGLVLLNTIYNGCEFIASIEDENPRRDAPPWIGLINGYNYIGVSGASLKFMFPEWRKFKGTMSSYEELVKFKQNALKEFEREKYVRSILQWPFKLVRIINYYGAYQVYKNFVYVVHNFSDLWVDKGDAKIIQEGILQVELVEKIEKGIENENGEIPPNPPFPKEGISRGIPDESLGDQKSSHISENIPPPKQKIKTRKPQIIQNDNSQPLLFSPSHNKTPNKSNVTQNPDEDNRPPALKQHDKIRAEKLPHLLDLRKRSQVKRSEIERELIALIRILPNGELKSIIGSEWQLNWQWEGQKFSLKFETPHGGDEVFTRTKLRKILNILMIGYLWGAEKSMQKEYEEQFATKNALGSFWFVFAERPKFNVQF